jgi:hypothetical protein
MHHDTSLRELGVLEERVRAKMEGYDGHNLLASVYEQMAEVYASKGANDFFSYF